MKVHRSGRSVVLLLAVAAVLWVSACHAQPAENRAKINISILQEEIAIQEKKIRQSGEEESTVLDELDNINSVVEQQQRKVFILQKQLFAQQQTLAEIKENLKQAENVRDKALQHMLKRLRSFYMMGKLGVLNVTFSNKDLPELLLCTDAFQHVIAYDRTVIDQYRGAVAELKKATFTQEVEESLLEELVRQAEEEAQVLGALRADREKMLTNIKTKQGLYALAIREMRKAEKDLRRTLNRLSRNEKKSRSGKRGIQLAKGLLPPPADGSVLHEFGEVLQDGLRKGETVNGIYIEMTPGTSAHAVYGGRVVFSGYRRAYGNAVIIDHGADYFTVTSRLDTILVREGERVEKNQQIGISGDIAILYEPGLYFEIRQGSTPLDPLEWLQAD